MNKKLQVGFVGLGKLGKIAAETIHTNTITVLVMTYTLMIQKHRKKDKMLLNVTHHQT